MTARKITLKDISTDKDGKETPILRDLGTVATSSSNNSRHHEIRSLSTSSLRGGGVLIEIEAGGHGDALYKVPLLYLNVTSALELAKGILMSLPARTIAEDHEIRQIIKMVNAYNSR